MTKVTLDMDTFKALASDTRLDILKTLDGKKMSLKDISAATKLNKATLHEHLVKLNEAGLVKKKEREGHKFVSYKLTWKGESLLHPENTRIVVMFATTFIALSAAIIQMVWYIKGTVMNLGYRAYPFANEVMVDGETADKAMGIYKSTTATNGIQLPPLSSGFLKDFFTHGKTWSAETDSSYFGGNLSIAERMDLDGMIPSVSPGMEEEGTNFFVDESQGIMQAIYQNPMFLYIAIACFVIFTIVLSVSLWRLWENKTPKL